MSMLFTRLVSLGIPAAADVDAVHAAYDADEAVLAFPGPFTNPDVPRNISVTFAATWDGGDVTVVGTNQFDEEVSETITAVAASTQLGEKIFKTVTSASKALEGAAAVGASIGFGDFLGVPFEIGNRYVTVFDTGVPTGVPAELVYHSIDVGGVPDGLTEIMAIVPEQVYITALSPEGVVKASIGSLRIDEKGRLWVKNTGNGATGWIQRSS